MLGAMVLLATLLAGPADSRRPGDVEPESLRPGHAEPADSLQPGHAIPRLACAQAPGYSYAVYLPSGYTPERRWPILFCFDPARRGMVPIRLFREAAERRGWILASSNDFSSADSIAGSTAAMAALWNDAIARFRIDLARVHAAGFSGGGRIAWLLDYLTRDVPFAGLIEVGAGIPWTAWPADWIPADLVFYGLVGERDFNYDEMEHLLGQLGEKRIRARLVAFDGGHEWPDSSSCGEAIDWMEVAAMGTGTAARDDSLIAAVVRREMARAAEFERADQPIEAFRIYEALVRDCDTLAGVPEARRGIERLRSGWGLAERLRRREAEAKRNAEALAAALDALRSFAAPEEPEALPSARSLRESMGIPALLLRAGGTDPEAAAGARRVLDGIYMRLSHEFAPALLATVPARAERLLTVAVSLQPENPEAWLRLARARSRAGWVKDGLDALEQSLAHGLGERERLFTDPDLQALREDPRFEAIVGAAPLIPATPASPSGPSDSSTPQ